MSKRYEVVCQSEKQRLEIMKTLEGIKELEGKQANGLLILTALNHYLDSFEC